MDPIEPEPEEAKLGRFAKHFSFLDSKGRTLFGYPEKAVAAAAVLIALASLSNLARILWYVLYNE